MPAGAADPDRLPGLTLVVPIFGTPDLIAGVARALPALEAAARRRGFRFDGAVVADDGSPDAAAMARAVAACGDARISRRRTEPNRGKGFAVKSAALACKSDFVLMSDADLSAPLSEFEALAAVLTPDTAMACGVRRRAGTGRSALRRALSVAFHLLTCLAGAAGVRDTQCGFKLFRMSAMRPVFEALRTERFAFDVELIKRARRAGWRVAEAEVEWHGGRRSTLHVLRDGARMLYDLVRIAAM